MDQTLLDLFTAVRLRSLRRVLQPDSDYRLSQIFRWYSKTFHTPLHVVADLPLEDVIGAFYESSYENMEQEQLEAERIELTQSPEERWAREMEEARAAHVDDAFFEHVKGGTLNLSLKSDSAKPKLVASVPASNDQVPMIKPDPEPTLVPNIDPDELPPDVTVVFTDNLFDEDPGPIEPLPDE